jgi:hypothetical protein
MARIEVVNMEYGLPTADEARKRLVTELDLARRKGVKVLKLIHGYGSSGRGGKLRTALRSVLRKREQQGTVGRIIEGEVWSIFDEASRGLLDHYPDLRGDRDLEKGNAGITLVEISRTPAT